MRGKSDLRASHFGQMWRFRPAFLASFHLLFRKGCLESFANSGSEMQYFISLTVWDTWCRAATEICVLTCFQAAEEVWSDGSGVAKRMKEKL